MEWYEWASDLIFTPLVTDVFSIFSPVRYEQWINDAKETVSSWLGW